ncbi:outer membrane protein assembly factor BamE [Paraburkholderia sp. MMS20-SJTR3]|uniref:Outer membrane protein assembly factor BamE n=1 Tax=Paraburkholderia sejongensis TaxID=2886946 RepID=A0ABS8K6E1_9BURK|nr:OmpA family protein [Paraburkholderia sp. MMS20-SJTR3]MCC8397494.1 outer membrane protein assembly factor BamE [Paraburkholderia sp. MMS20-SJTR3]
MNLQYSKHFAPILRLARLTVVGLAAAVFLTACGTSRLSNFDDNGHLAAKSAPVFPKIEDNHWQPEGTFPNLDNLRRVGPGLTKNQLYDLLGRPHFDEGEFNVREWDYVFNFRTGKGNEYITCQYKVLFDHNKLAQEFYWKPDSCADQLTPKVAAPTANIIVPAAAPRKVTLSADALFAFDRSDLGNMQRAGKEKLDQLAVQLRQMKSLKNVQVLGYTDRLGSDAHNLSLSQARAATVRSYLMQRGVPAVVIDARGMGSAAPVVMCSQKSKRALIDCLHPNRRVELLIAGED